MVRDGAAGGRDRAGARSEAVQRGRDAGEAVTMFPTAQAGALLRGMAERGERRTRNDGRSRKVSHDAIPLADLDILPDQSSRWQRMADVPEKVIAEYVESEVGLCKGVSLAAVTRAERTSRLCVPPTAGSGLRGVARLWGRCWLR